MTAALHYHLDLDTGDVWEVDDETGMWTIVGTIPGVPGGGDGLQPGQVTGLVLSQVQQADPDDPDGAYTVALIATWDTSPEADVIGYEVQLDAYDDLFIVFASQWAGSPTAVFDHLIPGHTYYARVRAYDSEGLYGAWSEVANAVTFDDGVAPGIPSDVEMIAGYQLFSLGWTLGSEPDLDHYDIQWCGDLTGVPDVASATIVTTTSTLVVITGLDTGVLYYARVRAVDAAGFCQTSATDPTPVLADTADDAGWCDWLSATTLLVGASDLAVHDLAAQFVKTGVLDANRVNTGLLTLGKTTAPGGSPVGIMVWDSLGRFLGWWDETGMLMVNPEHTEQAMWLNAGSLQFTSLLVGASVDPALPPPRSVLADTTWQTAISPYGIDAEAVTFGAATSGHNILPNSSFELQAFGTTSETTGPLFTLAADWATGTGRINLDVTTGDLKLTAL